MRIHLQVWRQAKAQDKGGYASYTVENVIEDMSFLEMLDILNDQLTLKGERPIAFDHDCREGICGSCGFVINGHAHAPQKLTTACQLFMRHFRDGDTITVEPFRAAAFPVLQDLVVDRVALDGIMQAGGFISARTGSAPDANAVPIGKERADRAMDAAQCIGCGACVAACPNGSAMLFTSAKVSHLGLLPQGQPERSQRALRMVHAMEQALFGACSNHGECEAACPKGISLEFIARLNRDFLKASLTERMEPVRSV